MPDLPEQQARANIDAMLAAAGWAVQDYKAFNPSVSTGIALCEVPLKSGRCDYLLLVNRRPLGVVEAKKEGVTLSTVAEQSAHYAQNLPDFLATGLGLEGLPFRYESTGVETFFRDERDPHPRPRRVFSFHRPETLLAWIASAKTLRALLGEMAFTHPLNILGMRDCQIEGITGLEQSLASDHPRALIQMATGSGKTFTACAFTYRLIKFAKATRVLFLVDRANLGRQAKTEFDQYVLPDDGRTFTAVYNVQHLTSNKLDDVCRVTICTIQRLYSMLRGEELPEDADELSTYEIGSADDRPKDVAYSSAIPIETFDFIVTDECHRSIYGLWRQVLEYFDAHLIGLTATPSKQTVGFFGQNLVMEYGHERAVADGVNVGYEVYRIKTRVTEQGDKVEKGFYVDRRHKETRRRRWERLDEDLAFTDKELDRSIVVPSQIRTVLTAYRDALFTELFPGRSLVPKTLIFAKDDSHAEDIVHLVWEVFGKGTDFCKKITYQAKHPTTGKPAKSEDLIAEFRTSPQLRIAVTVDMIATGTDIKPLECLLFLRDVRSRVYFEQMKGRGTRVLTPTDLQSVSGAEARAKTHFVIVDAVGVCESDKTESRPLERKPTVAFAPLMLGVALGKRDEDSLTTLAGRLARLDRELTLAQQKEVATTSGGHSLGQMAKALLQAFDPDAVAEHATGIKGAEPQELSEEAFTKAQTELITTACAPFDNPALRDLLAKVKQDSEQTIATSVIDEVIEQGFSAAAKDKAAALAKSFRDYIEQHQAEIAALQILYSRPYAQRLTEPMLKELEKKLREQHAAWTEDNLWNAFAATAPDKVKGRTQAGRFADLVSLVRFALEQQPLLKPFADSVNERFEQWLSQRSADLRVRSTPPTASAPNPEDNAAHTQSGPSSSQPSPAAANLDARSPFTPDQLAWLKLIRDHIATSLSIEMDDLDYTPFNQEGGLGKAHQLFGDQLPKLLEELNEALAA